MTPEREKEYREHWSHQYDELLAEIDRLRGEVKKVFNMFERVDKERDELREKLELTKETLDESVKLQTHYAKLLNMHDGGTRLTFSNAEEWIDRLAKIRGGK